MIELGGKLDYNRVVEHLKDSIGSLNSFGDYNPAQHGIDHARKAISYRDKDPDTERAKKLVNDFEAVYHSQLAIMKEVLESVLEPS